MTLAHKSENSPKILKYLKPLSNKLLTPLSIFNLSLTWCEIIKALSPDMG